MSGSAGATIAAVVPTFNRRREVDACLRGLLGQTRPPDAVVVVDNGSTDGTRDLDVLRHASVIYHHVAEPCGSAGGFAEGIRRAVELGYEWVWLMDNDACPERDALEELLRAAERYPAERVFNSLVVVPGGRNINWGYHHYVGDHYTDGTRVYTRVADLVALDAPVLNGLAQFYTGSLIHREVVERAGLPSPGYFTRGDEVDYVLRIQAAGFKTWTVVGSRATHPEERQHEFTWLGRVRHVPAMPPWKQYYSLRNSLINGRRYRFSGESMPSFLARSLALYLVASTSFPDHRLRRLWYSCWAVADALRGRLYVNKSVR